MGNIAGCQQKPKVKKAKKSPKKEMISEENTAQDISVGAEGTMWIIGTINGGAGGNQIRKWNETNKDWDPFTGEGVRIAVTAQGDPWITNALEDVYAYTKGSWLKVGVRSTDIGASSNGHVTVVGDSANHTLWRNVDGPVEVWWPLFGQKAKSVAGDPQGNPWIIGLDDGLVYRWTGSAWEKVPGAKGTDIGIGADGTVWIASDEPAESRGYQVARWKPEKEKWIYYPKIGATRVAVFPNGDLAAVDNQGAVFKLSKKSKKD